MAKRKLSSSIYNQAYEDRDKGGSTRQTYMDWKKILPDKKSKSELEFEAREGVNKLDIIPYEVKSKLHPLVKAGKMEVGELDFMLDIYVHRYVGPNGADVLCPKKNYGKPCPICEEASKSYQDGKKEVAKKLNASRRVLLNVIPIVQGEKQPMQIFEASHFLFIKELIEEAYESAHGDLVPFADLEKGKTIKFRAAEATLDKNTYFEFKSFDFLDRDEELDESLINKTISFDAGLILLPYEDIEKILWGKDEDEDAPAPAKKIVDDDEDAPAPAKKTDDNDEEEKPKVKKADHVEGEEDEKADNIPSGLKGKHKDGECPYDYKWGQADNHKECKKCSEWEKCVEA